MNRKAQELKTLLLRIVNTQKQDLTGLVSNPDIDFSRNRKIPYEKMILSLLTMEGTTLTNELLRQFGCDASTATSSAFICTATKENSSACTRKTFSRFCFSNISK